MYTCMRPQFCGMYWFVWAVPGDPGEVIVTLGLFRAAIVNWFCSSLSTNEHTSVIQIQRQETIRIQRQEKKSIDKRKFEFKQIRKFEFQDNR